MNSNTQELLKKINKTQPSESISPVMIAQIYPYAKAGMEQEISYIMSDLQEAPYYDESISYIDQGASLSIPTSVVSDVEQLRGFKDTVDETLNEAKVEMGENDPMYLNVVKKKGEALLHVSNVFIDVLESEGVKNFEDVGLTKEEILAKEMEKDMDLEEEKGIF